MKKLLLVSAILGLTSSIALAGAAPYIGGGLGITNNTLNIKANKNDKDSITIGSYRGVPFNLFAGYGGVLDQNFYLAGELSGTVGTANLSNNKDLKTSYTVGASIIPGLMLSDHSMLYGRAGVVRSNFPGQNDKRNGGQVGVGIQTSLTQNVDIRGEYDFTAYKSINVPKNVGGGSITPRSDQFNLGLVYKFD